MMESQVAYLTHLSKTHRQLQRERNAYIYKIIVAVLTLDAAFSGSLLSGAYRIQSELLKIGIAVFVVALALLTSWHLFMLHRSNHTNQGLAEQSETLCLAVVNGSNQELSLNPRKRKYRGCHIWFWQSCFVFAGMFATMLVLFST